MPPASMASSSENIEAARGEHHVPLLLQPSREAGEEEEGEWEEDADEEEERGVEVEKALQRVQELFDKGSNAIVDTDFTDAVDCFSRALEIRVAHCGKLSSNCANTYYKYGYALLQKAQSKSRPSSYKGYTEIDLDLAWKMLHIAMVILEKNPGSTIEKVEIFSALAVDSMKREDMDYSLGVCFKALAILENMVEPDHLRIIQLNLRICSVFGLMSRIGDAIPYCAKAISLCNSSIQSLKNATEAMLTDNSSAAEGGSEKSYLDDEIEFFTKVEKKLEDLEQAMSTPTTNASGEQNVGNAVPRAASLSSSQMAGLSNGFDSPTMPAAATTGSTESTVPDLGVVGRGIKRANVKHISAEPSPKKLAEDSPSVRSESSSSSSSRSSYDVHPQAQNGNDSVQK